MTWQFDALAILLLLSSMVLAAFALLARQRYASRAAKLFSQVIQSMPDAVLVLDASQRVIKANRAAEQIVGQISDKLIGKTLVEVFPGQDMALHDLLTNNPPCPEIRLGVASMTRCYDTRFSPLKDHKEQTHGWVLMLHDITAHKEAEETIQAHNAELIVRNRELDAFSHTVAHDLKSPITNIIGYSQLLLSLNTASWNQESGGKHLETIQESGYKIAQMIDSLLLLANIRDMRAILIPVNMTSVAQTAVERFRLEINRKRIDVTIGDLPSVPGEPLWLEEVFANLISNAIKYMGRANHTPRIAIQGFTLGEFTRYEVQDNGLGINPDDQQKLFEMFSRFHQAEAAGLGLGLSIVRQIVTRLNGKVGVENRPDGGSTFWFMLPANNYLVAEMPGTSVPRTPETASIQ